MRAQGPGGSLLVVAAGNDAWRESILQLFHLATFSRARRPELEDGSKRGTGTAGHARPRGSSGRRPDRGRGAVVLTDQCELPGFGAKIGRRKGWPQVEQAMLTKPITGAAPSLVHPGATRRHPRFLAALFIQDQPHAVALVRRRTDTFRLFNGTARRWSTHIAWTCCCSKSCEQSTSGRQEPVDLTRRLADNVLQVSVERCHGRPPHRVLQDCT